MIFLNVILPHLDITTQGASPGLPVDPSLCLRYDIINVYVSRSHYYGLLSSNISLHKSICLFPRSKSTSKVQCNEHSFFYCFEVPTLLICKSKVKYKHR